MGSEADFQRLRDNVQAQADRATAELIGTMDQLVPNVCASSGDPDRAFNFSLILDPQRRQGDERLLASHQQANFEPSARCTLALPGETAGASGLASPATTTWWSPATGRATASTPPASKARSCRASTPPGPPPTCRSPPAATRCGRSAVQPGAGPHPRPAAERPEPPSRRECHPGYVAGLRSGPRLLAPPRGRP